MAEPSLSDKLAAASSFILQSPPGEVNDVFNDVRPLVGDDAALETQLLPALSQYNLEQFTIVDIPSSDVPAIVCPAAQLPSQESRYLHTHSSQTFTFDHLRLAASDLQPYHAPHPETETLRKGIEAETGKYVLNHYEGGVWAVLTLISVASGSSIAATDPAEVKEEVMEVSTPAAEASEAVEVADEEAKEAGEALQEESRVVRPPSPVASHAELEAPVPAPSQTFQINFVGNKYNPSNYWTGRWRSSYTVDLKTGELKGKVLVNVHYYEQGNVQLSTDYSPTIPLPNGSNSTSSQILKAIGRAEEAYQTRLNAAYGDLGDRAFRSLRRALPVTKAKINWARLGNYKMKAELEK